MRLANYVAGGRRKVGLVEGGEVYELGLPGVETVDDVLSTGRVAEVEGSARRIMERSKGVGLESVKLLSPVLSPEKILLAAVNYVSHGNEQDVKPPAEPYFFTKFRNALMGDGDPIVIPRVSKKVDWEVELAVIIGKKGKYISKSAAPEHIAGYAVANDVSFRDLQFPEGWPRKLSPLGQNWVQGKSLDSSFPLGPWLVTREEAGDVGDLQLDLKVNGKTVQHASTSDMVFGCDELVAYISRGMTLSPGDVISTGTPLGVAVFTGEPFLADGDKVEASVEGIGTLHNPVKKED